MQTEVLHLANDFLGSTVYRELYDKLKECNVDQTVYCPMREHTTEAFLELKNRDVGYKVVYSETLKEKHRFFFNEKIRYLYGDIIQKIDFNHIQVIHATTLFSDGALAYKLYRKYNIPYIVTVRNTDLNIYLKYMVHLRSLGIAILRNARKIVFITPVYLNRFNRLLYLDKYLSEFQSKTTIIPNGVNAFWIDNPVSKKPENILGTEVNLLYIGNFSRNKNLKTVIKAVENLNNTEDIYRLAIVGGGKGNLGQLVKKKEFIRFYGKISERAQLQSIIRSADIFVMPSKQETFGLVYIEALSQGLPVVYTKDEGIYGLHNSNIGEAVDPNDIGQVQDALVKIAKNYSHYDFSPKHVVKQHDWRNIASQYEAIYKEIAINENPLYPSIF